MADEDMEKARILVAYHDRSERMALIDGLSHLGLLRLEESSSAGDVRERIAQQDVDAVILGEDLPDASAYETLQWLRTDADSPDPFVPVVVIMANPTLDSLKDMREAGASAILAKPVTPTTAYKRLQEACLRPRSFVVTGSYFGPDRRHPRGHVRGD